MTEQDIEMTEEEIAEMEQMFDDATEIALKHFNAAIAENEDAADVIALSFIEVAMNQAAELAHPDIVIEIAEDLIRQMREAMDAEEGDLDA